MITITELLNEVNSLFPGWKEAGHPYTDDISVSHEHFYLTYSYRHKNYRSVSNLTNSNDELIRGYSDISATESILDLKEQIKSQLELVKSIYDTMGDI
jgi:hypothetical protein